MNNKILISSIIAITILIGVSFTSVVGYNSVESYVNKSPLFYIRTSRAIDEEDLDLSFEYVGKGIPTMIVFPNRNSGNEIIQKIIDKISDIHNIQFNRYVKLNIHKIHPLIRENYDFIEKNKIDITKEALRDKYAFNPKPHSIDNYAPGCFIYNLIGFIIMIIVLVILNWIVE